MTSSSTETNRRGVSALSEHGRQDGWTSTPFTSSGSGGCDELAGERLPKTTPAPDRRKKHKEEACLTTAKKGEQQLDRNADEHLGARLPHPGEEAGSIVFHSSSNTSEIRNDNNESRATASRREETRQGEKHKLKDVSKCIKKMHQRKKE